MNTAHPSTRLALPGVLFGILLLVGIGQLMYFYPRLPQTMASHFGADGKVNGWSSKRSFVWLMAGVYALTSAVFAISSLLLPKLPVSMINLPKRDYWLAPERRQATLAYISTWMLWFGTATLCLLLAITSMTLRVNLTAEHRLPGWSWVIIMVYLAFTALWIVMMFMRFHRVQTHSR